MMLSVLRKGSFYITHYRDVVAAFKQQVNSECYTCIADLQLWVSKTVANGEPSQLEQGRPQVHHELCERLMHLERQRILTWPVQLLKLKNVVACMQLRNIKDCVHMNTVHQAVSQDSCVSTGNLWHSGHASEVGSVDR